MKETLELKESFSVKPSVIYKAWLDSDTHTNMTGGEAHCGNQVGDTFTAWDGYITGKNLELTPNKEIVQAWRTSEFDESDEDSKLTVRLVEIENGTEMTLIHTNIPEGQTQYKQGWVDHYFEPMKKYFG